MLLVTSGSLVSQKGYESLLEACNKLNKDSIKFRVSPVLCKKIFGKVLNI